MRNCNLKSENKAHKGTGTNTKKHRNMKRQTRTHEHKDTNTQAHKHTGGLGRGGNHPMVEKKEVPSRVAKTRGRPLLVALHMGKK